MTYCCTLSSPLQVRIAESSTECQSALEHFRHNLQHYRHVFECFIVPSSAAQPPKGKLSDDSPRIVTEDSSPKISQQCLRRVARCIAGKVGPLLNYCFTPASGVVVARAVKRELDPNATGEDYFKLACVELSQQLTRNKEFSLASDAVYNIIRPFYPAKNGKKAAQPRGTLADAAALLAYAQGLEGNQKVICVWNVFCAFRVCAYTYVCLCLWDVCVRFDAWLIDVVGFGADSDRMPKPW